MTDRIEHFLDLLSCVQPLWYWRFDSARELLETTCPAGPLPVALLRHDGALEAAAAAEPGPAVFSNDADMTWIVVRETPEQEILQFHLMGPFYIGASDPDKLESYLQKIRSGATELLSRELEDFLRTMPAVPILQTDQYAIMLEYLVSGRRLAVSDLQYLGERRAVPADFSNLKTRTLPKDRLQIYRAERALLNAVREGDIESGAALVHATGVTRVRQYTGDPLRNTQIACTTFAALCTRAAIEGGLSTTISYSLGDAYIKSFFLARSTAEVSDIKNQMYQDFIARVHRCRHNPHYSKPVQSCCDFIETHLSEPLSIELLADRLGYAKYYLSSRFKKETGVTVGDYIKYARIERGKMLLATTDKSIADIAEMTGFASRSFFSNTFKRCLGKTPAAYRREVMSI